MEISIIGGGITGLSTALGLYKMGYSPQVYESSPALNEVGAGILMQPNAIKVLDWLGIGKEVRNKGVSLENATITNAQLIPFRETSAELTSHENGQQIVAIHRARLQETLLSALPEGCVHLGEGYRSHSLSGEQIEVELAKRSVKTDILLGADGIHSQVRGQVFPSSSIRYSGQTCWRGISDAKLPESLMNSMKEAWGYGVRLGFTRISDHEVYWFAVAKAEQGGKDVKDTVKSELLDRFTSFHPVVRDIVEKTPVSRILRNDITDLKRLESWSQGRVCLLGDAAHATTPNMGQGAGQGIEDAYYFSHVFAASDSPVDAFQEFESIRRKKVDYVVNNSWRFGKLAHNNVGRWFMRTMMKMTPERMMVKQMGELFSVKEY